MNVLQRQVVFKHCLDANSPGIKSFRDGLGQLSTRFSDYGGCYNQDFDKFMRSCVVCIVH